VKQPHAHTAKSAALFACSLMFKRYAC